MFSQPKTIFTTEAYLKDIIPPPVPARTKLPNWYRHLPNFVEGPDKFMGRTLKRCPPVLDAMSAGYILTTPAEIEVRVNEEGDIVDWKSDFVVPVIEAHTKEQIGKHPKSNLPPLKFLNYWQVTTTKGWSTLFTPLLSQEDSLFTPMSGIVETDKYFEYVNFPGFLNFKGTTKTIPRGYPLVQAVPFRRGMDKKAIIRGMTPKEEAKLRETRMKRTSQPSLYRETMWERK